MKLRSSILPALSVLALATASPGLAQVRYNGAAVTPMSRYAVPVAPATGGYPSGFSSAAQALTYGAPGNISQLDAMQSQQPSPVTGNPIPPAPARTPGQTMADSTKQNGQARPQSLIAPAGPQASYMAMGTRLAGRATAMSGDSVLVDGHRVTLRGVSAPPPGTACFRGALSWPCGNAARESLEKLLARGPVVCTVLADSAAGTVATCRLGPDDLSQVMVGNGMAAAGERPLRPVQQSAMDYHRGLWVETLR